MRALSMRGVVLYLLGLAFSTSLFFLLRCERGSNSPKHATGYNNELTPELIQGHRSTTKAPNPNSSHKHEDNKYSLTKFKDTPVLESYQFYASRLPENRDPAEKQHVVFLKVHKAGSTTIQNVLTRFALFRGLNLLIGVEGPSGHFNQIHERFPVWRILPIPSTSGRLTNETESDDNKFDILCSHVIFDYETLSPFFPEDSIYVGAVRRPFDQFISAFKYYRARWARDKGIDPIGEFFKSPLNYSNPYPVKDFTNNRMSIDFGFNLSHFEEKKLNSHNAMRPFLEELDRRFHFVIIIEYFEESMVMLRRFLNWSLKDILFIKRNSLSKTMARSKSPSWLKQKEYTDELRIRHKKWAPFDDALYEHFESIFRNKLKVQSPDFFKEVEHYKDILRKVERYCNQRLAARNFFNSSVGWIEQIKESDVFDDASNYKLPESRWSGPIEIRLEDCVFMEMSEPELMSLARRVQVRRLYEGREGWVQRWFSKFKRRSGPY